MTSNLPVVLITGSSRGLGRGIAEACAYAGWNVVVHYTSHRSAAEETVASCLRLASCPEQRFELVQGSIQSADDRNRIFCQTMDCFGSIDALVNNAGMAPRVRTDLLEMSEESFDEVMDVNLKGAFFLSQRVAREWISCRATSRLKGGFKLVFVTSISAFTASVGRGEYCISKAGLSMGVQLFASRLAAEGIQVFEIRPGLMETDMTASVHDAYTVLIEQGLVPQKRWGNSVDVGLSVRSVLEGAFPFSTGDVFHVDGGFHLRRL